MVGKTGGEVVGRGQIIQGLIELNEAFILSAGESHFRVLERGAAPNDSFCKRPCGSSEEKHGSEQGDRLGDLAEIQEQDAAALEALELMGQIQGELSEWGLSAVRVGEGLG